MLASNNLFPLISLPMRITERSFTIIDHIVTNDHEHSILPGIIRTDITDHYPIFCSIELSTLSKKSDEKFFKRDLQHFNSETFCENLHESIHNFFITTGVINCHNFNEVFAGFTKVIEKVIDPHAPFKKLSRKKRE